jgi:hypothetical protein
MGAESTRPKQDRQCWPLTSSAKLGAVTDPPMSDVGDEARGIDDVVVIGDEEAPEPPPPYEFDPTDVKPAAPGWTPPTRVGTRQPLVRCRRSPARRSSQRRDCLVGTSWIALQRATPAGNWTDHATRPSR